MADGLTAEDPSRREGTINPLQANDPGPVDRLVLPTELDAFVRRSVPELVGRVMNTLVVARPEPIVDPPPRLWHAHDPRWGATFMRADGQRNAPGAVTKLDNWSANGCHPACVATVLHWLDRINPTTAQRLFYPFAGGRSQAPSGALVDIDPIELCRRLFNTPFVSSKLVTPKAAGTFNPDDFPARLPDGTRGRFDVDHAALIEAAAKVRLPSRQQIPTLVGLFAGAPAASIVKGFAFSRPSPRNSGKQPEQAPERTIDDVRREKKLAIKFLLQWGPVVLLLERPSHWVVAEGYRGDELFIADPGNIVNAQDKWEGDGIRRRGGRIDHLRIRTDVEVKFGGVKVRSFLDTITLVQVFIYDPLDIHHDFSLAAIAD